MVDYIFRVVKLAVFVELVLVFDFERFPRFSYNSVVLHEASAFKRCVELRKDIQVVIFVYLVELQWLQTVFANLGKTEVVFYCAYAAHSRD